MKPRVVQLVRQNAQGRDDLVLDVSGPRAGSDGVLLGEGSLKAMYHAPRTTPEQVLASMPGAVPGRDRVEKRVFRLRLRTEATGSSSWEDTDSLLWSVVRPESPFLVRIESDNGGEVREGVVRRFGTPELVRPDGFDPASVGWAVWDVDVAMFDPWWYGTKWSTDEAEGPGAKTLRLRNQGDHEGYVRWVIRESEAAQTWKIPDALGVYPVGHSKAGQRITVPLPAIAAGKHGLVDTSPQRLPLSVLDEPMAFGKLRQTRFTHKIPPNSGWVDMPVVGTGSATAGIQVKLRPAYERPYGGTR